MKFTLKIFFLFLLLSNPAYADSTQGACAENLFTPCDDDISIVFLNSITGDITNADAPQTIFGSLFTLLNSLVINIGLLLIIYTVIVSSISAATTGKFMFEEGTAMQLTRLVMGLMLLLTFPSGYSLAQYFFYQVIQAGVGLADSVWSKALVHLDNDTFFVTNSDKQNSDLEIKEENFDNHLSAMEATWKGLLCSYHHNTKRESNYTYEDSQENLATRVFNYSSPVTARSETPEITTFEENGYTTKSGNILHFAKWYGPQFYTVDESNVKILFGFNNPKFTPTDDTLNEYSQCGSVVIPSSMKNVYEDYIEKAYLSIYPGIMNVAEASNDNTCGQAEQNPSVLKTVETALGQGFNDVVSFNTGADSFTSSGGGLEDKYAGFGWAVAGFYYNKTLVTDSKDSKLAPIPESSVTGGTSVNSQDTSSGNNDSLFFANTPSCSLYFQKAKSKFRSEVLNSPVPEFESAISEMFSDFNLSKQNAGAQSAWIAVVSAFVPVARLAEVVWNGFGKDFGSGKDPFAKVKRNGKIMMDTAVAMLLTALSLIIVHVALVSLASACVPEARVAAAIVNVLIIILLALIGGAYVQGAMLAVFLPLIPVIIYVGGVIGWLFSVFESFVAAPFVALGILWPGKADSFFGKAEPAVMILLNIFLRPSLMVIGLLLGLYLCWVGFGLMSLTFQVALTSGFMKPDLLIGWLPVGFLFAATLLAVAQKCFGLIFELPDKILTWLGEQVMSWGAADDLLMASQRGITEGGENLDQMASQMKSFQSQSEGQNTDKSKKQDDESPDATTEAGGAPGGDTPGGGAPGGAPPVPPP